MQTAYFREPLINWPFSWNQQVSFLIQENAKYLPMVFLLLLEPLFHIKQEPRLNPPGGYA